MPQATCGDLAGSKDGTSACYVSNHGAGTAFSGTVSLTAYEHFGSGAGVVVVSRPVAMAAGPVLRVFPPCALVSHAQGSSGGV